MNLNKAISGKRQMTLIIPSIKMRSIFKEENMLLVIKPGWGMYDGDLLSRTTKDRQGPQGLPEFIAMQYRVSQKNC